MNGFHENLTRMVPLGSARVEVKYSLEEGEDGGRDHPSYGDIATVNAVLVGGVWIDADLFSSEWVLKVEELLVNTKEEETL